MGTAPHFYRERLSKNAMAALPPIDVPAFGRWLENQRLSKKFANGQPWSQAEVAKRLRKAMAPFGVKVAEGQVDQFEGGKHPSWHWLFGLSVVFGVSLNETVSVLIDAMAEKDQSVRDLICQAKGVQTASSGGPPADETKRLLRPSASRHQCRQEQAQGSPEARETYRRNRHGSSPSRRSYTI